MLLLKNPRKVLEICLPEVVRTRVMLQAVQEQGFTGMVTRGSSFEFDNILF